MAYPSSLECPDALSLWRVGSLHSNADHERAARALVGNQFGDEVGPGHPAPAHRLIQRVTDGRVGFVAFEPFGKRLQLAQGVLASADAAGRCTSRPAGGF